MNSVLTEDSNKLKKLPSATTSVVYFLTMSIIYAFIMIYTTISSQTLSQVDINASNQIYTLIYVIFLITGTYFINVNISKSICNEHTIKWTMVFIITLFPWIIIFALLFFLLELFPGWVKPFSNTIGYLIVNALGATDVLKKILKSSNAVDLATPLQTALRNIEKNYSRFINEIDIELEDYKRYITQLNAEKFTRGDVTSNEIFNNKDVIDLYALIRIKDVIGKVFWYVLAGTLISSITYNYIIQMNCEKTSLQVDKEYSDMLSTEIIEGNYWTRISERDIRNKQNITNALKSTGFYDKYQSDFTGIIQDVKDSSVNFDDTTIISVTLPTSGVHHINTYNDNINLSKNTYIEIDHNDLGKFYFIPTS